jgi:DNA repair protein RecN (Recombination protein N)
MLSLLKIKHIALIDEIEIEFGRGLNLLTGETGSGKSIIVDSLGALTGERISSDLIKDGERSAMIEGLFSIGGDNELSKLLDEGGIEPSEDLIVRRELSSTGKNRVFVNNQLVTQGFLKKLGSYIVDIHGQGEQAELYDTANHITILDEYADVVNEIQRVETIYREWAAIRTELANLKRDEAEKLQLLDILKFQADEISKADLKPDEEEQLEEEKRRLNNVEKLSALSAEIHAVLYDNDESSLAALERASRDVEELTSYDSKFGEYREGLQSALAVIEDLAIAARDFRNSLEFSPERLSEIEDRLAEITRLKRKYGGTVAAVLEHLANTQARLERIESAEFREEELQKKLAQLRKEYIAKASELHAKREAAARKFEKQVEQNLKAVALEKAGFQVRFNSPSEEQLSDESASSYFGPTGFDRVEFYFSANPGESPKPLARVASGGEASRVMLVLKTTSRADRHKKSAVFDEIDVGIGGRVAEAVGLKLKELSRSIQVMCVTHQPQIASLADHHFVVEKSSRKNSTAISVRTLETADRVEEIARMLAGQKVTDAARTNAREMLKMSGVAG